MNNFATILEELGKRLEAVEFDIMRLNTDVAQLDRTMNVILAHQARNDTKLEDVTHVRQWWKRSPPVPPDYEALEHRLRDVEARLARLRASLEG